MQLYYNPMSVNARRVMLAAAHLNAPLDMRLITNMREPEQRAALLAVNPNAKVPVLVDGDFVLWESGAIIQYLAEKTPGQTVYPTDLQTRMDIHRWMFWNAQHWAPPIGLFNWENNIKRWLGMGGPDTAVLARAEEELLRFARVLDDHLAGRQWVVGDALSLADFTLAAPLWSLEQAKLPVRDFAHLMAWFERVRALPAWQAIEAKA